jgi:hypothetical protein
VASLHRIDGSQREAGEKRNFTDACIGLHAGEQWYCRELTLEAH